MHGGTTVYGLHALRYAGRLSGGEKNFVVAARRSRDSYAPMLNIVEVMERSRQGVTRPFLCRCDDGQRYYAKGAGVGWKGLIAEWVSGRLGHALGFTIPPFDLAEAPTSLLKKLARDDQFDLGTAPVFVSRFVPHTFEFRYADMDLVSKRMQANILFFDCFIRNADRTLARLGGNPNLLWSNDTEQVQMIDHNLAFEPDPVAAIIDNHIFGSAIAYWSDEFRDDWEERAVTAISRLDVFWEELPSVWVERAAGIDRDRVYEILSRLPWDSEPSSLLP